MSLGDVSLDSRSKEPCRMNPGSDSLPVDRGRRTGGTGPNALRSRLLSGGTLKTNAPAVNDSKPELRRQIVSRSGVSTACSSRHRGDHGGFVDGSGWQSVYQQLTKDGYSVSVVQNPTLSLVGDADATRRVIDAQSEPVILVGHSYGGAVITEAGTGPNVKALVYIAAFMPDAGESVQTLIADLPPETGPPPLPPQDGFLLLDRAKFHQAFAGDVDDELATFMADAQVPWASRPQAAPSASRHGGASQAGTSSQPMTG
jgi:hypothetical protein